MIKFLIPPTQERDKVLEITLREVEKQLQTGWIVSS